MHFIVVKPLLIRSFVYCTPNDQLGYSQHDNYYFEITKTKKNTNFIETVKLVYSFSVIHVRIYNTMMPPALNTMHNIIYSYSGNNSLK